jgi:hypothetical protein
MSGYNVNAIGQLNNQYLTNIGNTSASGTGWANSWQYALNTIDSNLVNVNGAVQQTITQQRDMLNIVNNEKERLQKKKDAIADTLSSNKRAIELNESFRKKQQYYLYIFITIIIALILTILVIKFAPDSLKDLLVTLIGAISILIIGSFYYTTITRDNTNFDRIKTVSPITPASAAALKNQNPLFGGKIPGLTCVGQACCPANSKYSTILNQCVIMPAKIDAGSKYDPVKAQFVAECPTTNPAQDDATLGYQVCSATSSFATMGTASSAQPYTPSEFTSYAKL